MGRPKLPMSKLKSHTALRIPPQQVRAIEAYRVELMRATGAELSFATAVRALIARGLEVARERPFAA